MRIAIHGDHDLMGQPNGFTTVNIIITFYRGSNKVNPCPPTVIGSTGWNSPLPINEAYQNAAGVKVFFG